MGATRWKPEAVKRLRQLARTMPVRAIAVELGVSYWAVAAKLRELEDEPTTELAGTERVEHMMQLAERIKLCKLRLRRTNVDQ